MSDELRTRFNRMAALGCFLLGAMSIAVATAAEGDPMPATGKLSLTATSGEILGPDSAAKFASILPIDEPVTWEVVVPDNYDAENSPGVLVYISPSNSGTIPRRWRTLPELQNVIWVAANISGNEIAVARRITYTLLASGLIANQYSVNSDRIYLSGFSGGARVSGLVASTYPQLFRGAVYIGGAEIWDKRGPDPNTELMASNAYVFIVGSEDFNRRMASGVMSKYKKAGIDKVQFSIVPRKGHELPELDDMIDALKFLDANALR